MRIPSEVSDRPHRAKVREASLHAPKRQMMEIGRLRDLEIAPGSMVAIVGTGLGGQFTQG
jgi:hypothetical protein